jgi:hypothetical protein
MSDDDRIKASKAPPPVAEHSDSIALGLRLVLEHRGSEAASADAASLIGIALRFVLDYQGGNACLQRVADAASAVRQAVALEGGSPSGELH